MPPSDDVAPLLAQVHLFSRGIGPLRFRGGRFACGSALMAPFRCSPCKRRLRFFPFETTPVVRRVVAPTAAALGLPPRGSALSKEVRFLTPGCMSAVALHMAEARALQWAMRCHVRLHRDPQPAELDERSHSSPCATYDKMGWRNGPDRGGRSEAA
jgi:hypothetical protein